MTQEERIVIAERIAIALECLANYQQRALDISQRMADQQQQALAFAEQSAMASERMCIIAEYQLNDRLNNNNKD